MSDALVSVDRLTRTFALHSGGGILGARRQVVRAVTEVSFAVRRGSTFALVGESGAGKSTIAKLVVGLMKPDGGTVMIDGADIARGGRAVRTVRRRMQMVFQDPYASLNPRMTVGRIVAEPIEAFGLARGRGDAAARVAELLANVGLAPADAAKYSHQFSGGQRQRIAIARALASEPEFLVCDEPTSALDVSIQAQILNMLKDLQDRLRLTLLFISHNLAVVRYMADMVGVLYLGRLVEIAPAAALFSTPRHPYTRMLLDAVPQLDPARERRTPIIGEIASAIAPPPGCAFHPRCPLANARCRVELPRFTLAGATRVACHAVEEGRD